MKLGTLDQQKLIKGLLEPEPVQYRGSSWTFIDVLERDGKFGHYIYGKLCKYKPEGEVVIVDPSKRKTETQIEPNLRMASSPFVYIPEHSGIAFLNVSGQIEQSVFVGRFCSIIEETHNRFFVNCEIEMISDLRSFAAKVSSLDGIYGVKANVFPPNPMFGPLWKDLKDYLIQRNTDRLNISEEASQAEPLNTDLPTHIEKASKQTELDVYQTPEALPIGDAAILMAADGYGNGLVRGKQDQEFVTIKTSETVKNFTFNKDPDPEELYNKAKQLFDDIREKRHLEH